MKVFPVLRSGSRIFALIMNDTKKNLMILCSDLFKRVNQRRVIDFFFQLSVGYVFHCSDLTKWEGTMDYRGVSKNDLH